MLTPLLRHLGLLPREPQVVVTGPLAGLPRPDALADLVLDDFCDTAGALPVVHWRRLLSGLEAYLPADDLSAWYAPLDFLAVEWLRGLQDAYDGAYQIWSSGNFFLFTRASTDTAHGLLHDLERYRTALLKALPGIADSGDIERLVIMQYHDAADYYRYVQSISATVGPATAGMFIDYGYGHICLNWAPHAQSTVIVHEMTHSLVRHLRLPTWLNEGLAVSMEQAITGRSAFMLDRENAIKHLELWTPESIQRYWAGVSFGDDDLQQVSYELSYRLTKAIARDIGGDRARFVAFIQAAYDEDGGQSAAREILHHGLEHYVQLLMGDDDWAPDPVQIDAIRTAAYGPLPED